MGFETLKNWYAEEKAITISEDVALIARYNSKGLTAPGQTVNTTGTPGNDWLIGTNGGETIDGRGGDDYIFGGGGHDSLVGGEDLDSGSDTIVGGAGNDTLRGVWGDDYLYGDIGNDSLLGGMGNDVVYGGENDDQVFGNDGDDYVIGDAGDDQLWGGYGNDTLTGGEGADRFYFNELGEIFGNEHDVVTDFTAGDTLVITHSILSRSTVALDPTGFGVTLYVANEGGAIHAITFENVDVRTLFANMLVT
ncbi:MAG TPA: calcium-binding protein [Beijerinckiaceae bacterium]|nr:calcium-binding protein [Beijerinckiaceae bacterium]